MQRLLIHNFMAQRVFIALFLCLAVIRASAQGPGEGYRGIPWGSTESNLLQHAVGQMVSNRVLHVPDFENSGEHIMLGGIRLIHERTKKIVFLEKYNQRSEYIICDNRLVAVLNRPATHLTMDPLAVIEETQGLMGELKPTVRKDLKLPGVWGRLVQTETLQTFEWDTPQVLVRVPCRTWPIDDYRQAFFVVHVSKAQMQKNIERIEEIRKEEEEARRKAEEEAKRKAEEAAKGAAATPGP